MKKWVVLCLLLFAVDSYGQERLELDSIHVEFLKHLKKESLWEEGIHFLKLYSSTNTSNYYKGLFNYQQEKLDSSIFFFTKVKSNSSYWNQSRFLSAFQLAYKDSLALSKGILKSYNPADDLLKNLKGFQHGGISLLERDLSAFSNYEKGFGKFYQLAPYEEALLQSKSQIEAFKSKSPFTAGFLSALIPGAGRFYIGRPGEGVATLLVTGIFALQAREAYKKDGLKSPRFIIFGSLLSITYVSNIWGSVLSVKVANMEKNNQINEDILLNMHIPLRVIFD